MQDITEEDWDRTFAVNLKGAFLTCREAVRRWLAEGRSGRIVNVSSAAAFLGATTGHAHYAAAKAGLVNFTVSLAREVARQGIAVNAVAPGMMRTEMARDALEPTSRNTSSGFRSAASATQPKWPTWLFSSPQSGQAT